MQHNLRLNDFERFYFQKFFGKDLKRLERFRTAICKDQKCGINRGLSYTSRVFKTKGGKVHIIYLNKHKIDAYIAEISNPNPNS